RAEVERQMTCHGTRIAPPFNAAASQGRLASGGTMDLAAALVAEPRKLYRWNVLETGTLLALLVARLADRVVAAQVDELVEPVGFELVLRMDSFELVRRRVRPAFHRADLVADARAD